MKKNDVLIKLLISVLIVLTLFNFISSTKIEMNYSFASTEEVTTAEERNNGLISGFLSGIGNAIVDAIKSMILAPFRAARSLNYTLANAAGNTMSGAEGEEITPFDIFFNKFTLLDANIFSFTDRNGNPLPEEGLVYKIRANTAIWYYGIRTIAILIIAAMLSWNIFKLLAKSSTPEKQAIARNAITDWVLSFALVMFMHIIVILVLNFNDLLLITIEKMMPVGGNAKDFFDALENAVFNTNFILGVAALVVYALLNWQTLKYVLIYIQRLLTIVLLIMVAPIMPITYSTDRMRGGKGKALNGWLKELLFNVFVQSLHALIYAALVSVAMNALTSQSSITGTSDLGNAMVAIAALLFVKYAEKMLKSILGFDGSEVLNTNIFSNAATSVTNFAGSVRNVGARVATGGPLISFGQNVDGSHIGIGQVAQGIRTSANRTMEHVGNSIRNAPTAIGNAAGNAVNGVRNIPNAIREAGDSVRDGYREARGLGSDEDIEASENGEAEAAQATDGRDGANGNAAATATATAEASASVDQEENEGPKVVVVGGGKDFEAEKAQRNLDASQNAATRELRQDIEENLSEKEKSMRKLENAVNTVATDKKENNKEQVTEEYNTEVINNEEVIEDGVIGEGLDEASLEKIKEGLKDKITPELLDRIDNVLKNEIQPELLNAIRAINAGDNGQLAEITNNLNSELMTMLNNGSIDVDSAMEIDSQIDSKFNNPEELKEYINSFTEGSNERRYAEAYAKLSAVMAANTSDTDMNGKVEAVMNTNDALDTKKIRMTNNEVGNTVKPTGTSNVSSNEKADASSGIHTAGSARTMQAVNEAMNTESRSTTETTEPSVEMNTDPAIEDIKNDQLREMMIDLSEIDPIKYRVKGKSENEITAEIQEEFEATFEHFTEKMGRTPEGLNDIYKNMDAEAQKQFAAYRRQEIDAKDLRGDARALATLQIQASHLGFDMSVGQSNTTYEYNINGGEMRTSSEVQGVVTNLSSYRAQKQEEYRKNRGKHSA